MQVLNLAQVVNYNYTKTGWWTWTTETRQHYYARTADVVANTALTDYQKGRWTAIGLWRKNIADLAGLRVAYDPSIIISNGFLKEVQEIRAVTIASCKLITNGRPNSEKYCSSETAKSLRNYLDSDNYAPYEFRVVGALSHMSEFAQCYHCPLGSIR
ncbi:hypothetical protein BV898_08216 [Hypsibius exemplaris]|uniref:Peptidase M13 C-terminal domain-containing protein n=1 Tax=Hypsibius exemplaris TaxID=2072580 RepID=A0A1W0WRE4_HYPEX|nr:hypothetical protein BV898_08216 [Hypsibius exemplaris]